MLHHPADCLSGDETSRINSEPVAAITNVERHRAGPHLRRQLVEIDIADLAWINRKRRFGCSRLAALATGTSHRFIGEKAVPAVARNKSGFTRKTAQAAVPYQQIEPGGNLLTRNTEFFCARQCVGCAECASRVDFHLAAQLHRYLLFDSQHRRLARPVIWRLGRSRKPQRFDHRRSRFTARRGGRQINRAIAARHCPHCL